MTRRGRAWALLPLAATAAFAFGALAWTSGARAAEARAGAGAVDVAAFLESLGDRGFAAPQGPWVLSLPADHGGHDAARMESWAISAHLRDAQGRPAGVQVTLSRVGLRAEAGASPWTPSALHVAQAARTGPGAEAAGEERLSRGSLGVAGHDGAAGEAWLDDWTLSWDPQAGADGGALSLVATVEGAPVRLRLTPEKPALAIDADGRGPARGYAMPRMRVEGEIGAGEARQAVSGLAWLDHLWGALPPPGGPVARDRLILQLDDGTDLSLIRTRRRDGRGSEILDGVLAGPDGARRAIDGRGLSLTPTARWQAPGGGRTYALGYRIEGSGLALEVSPVLEDQRRDFAQPVWTGLVRVRGTNGGVAVEGLGSLATEGEESR
ncbi:lipocalin-like domain-containing protein [Albimonas sp. CAU 1670]|uniref:lipocalin-like domain-containing protein n=1 Tax=Albimonas sp. CAU 1670 TaxID=3032599 RepID=UPI0023DCE0A4|nr:lipocalin-like domain-containing protein [Albimonas sp. CAU 1670]MDF2231718.1 lipocalin-like domain-containing protein [Albimonas sp. CAU 1670]